MNYEDIESSIEVTTYLILHLAVSFIEVGVLLGVGPPGGVGALPEVPLLHALYPRLPPRRLPRLQSGHIQLYTFCRYSTFKIFNVQGECMAIPSYIGWHYWHLSTFLFKFPKLRSFDRRQERSVNQELPTSQTNKTVRLLTESHCNTFSLQVFLSHEPNHWCAQPGLDQFESELNWTQRLHLGSPLERQDGELKLYSRCSMYKVNWTDVRQVSRSMDTYCQDFIEQQFALTFW